MLDLTKTPKSLASFLYLAVTGAHPLATLTFSVWLWFTGTFFFDVVHYVLHQCSASAYRPLRLIGYLHMVHHYYFNRRLKFNKRYLWQNLCLELPLELGCQLFGTWLGWLVANKLPMDGSGKPSVEFFNLILIVQVARVFVVAMISGQDSNHITYKTVPKDPRRFTIGPEYHALHHVEPTAYMSSAFRVFDWLFGTGYSPRSRRITLTGASGAFGQALKKELQRDSVRHIQELKFGLHWDHRNYDAPALNNILARTDILILAHGSKGDDAYEANYTSVMELIALFRKQCEARTTILLPEIWYVGSEIEIHPSWGNPILQNYSRSKRAFLPHARALYDDDSIIYRHIVPAAFASRMGPAIVSAEWAARVAMWWIRRGARYVPVTYTGLAYLHYFKFMYWVKKAENTPNDARHGKVVGNCQLVR